MEDRNSLSLYLHIPFCRHRCAYCDFNTYTTVSDLKGPYTKALCQEISQVAEDQNLHAHTVFFGGGTPSLMPANLLAEILCTIRSSFHLKSDVEITLEANPETVHVGYLEALLELGVNRLSIGAQSANSFELNLLEREHSFEFVIQVVEMSRTAGFQNISLDLIYGLPGQSLDSWKESIQAVLALNIDHLSLYCLSIEPGTPMHRWLRTGRIEFPDPDIAADQYEYACNALATRGFIHYEISNWANPGFECKHNLSYWRNQEYLGLGAGAHGHANGFRYEVVKQPRVYIRRMKELGQRQYPWSSAMANVEPLDQQQSMSDTVIMQLRLLNEGLDLTGFFQRFGLTIYDAFPDVVEKLINWNLLHQEEGRLLLTTQGRFISNQVMYRFT